MKYLVITLLFLGLTNSAYAGLMESLASLSSNISGNDCNQSSAQITEEGTCDLGEAPLNPLPGATDDLATTITESTYFVELAEVRKSDFVCAVQYIQNIKNDSQKLESLKNDISEKLISYSELNADTVNLMGTIGRLARSVRYIRNTEEKASAEAELVSLREQLQKMQIATAAIRSSVPLIHLEPINDLFQDYSTRLNGPSVQIRNDRTPAAETMAELDRVQFSRDLNESLDSTLSSLGNDISTLNSGIESGGVSIDRAMRESLAQDLSLLETYQLQNPNNPPEMQELTCSVDQRYGSGAQTRDQILNFGSIGLTLASLGIGGVIRGSAAIGANFFNGARVAALSGMLSMRSANVLSAIAIGLDAGAGINEIGRSCFGDSLENMVRSSPGTCQEPTIEQNNQDNCILASGLTALGIGLASPAGQQLLARAITPLSRSTPQLPRSLIERSRPYTNTNQIPGGGSGALSTGGLTEGRYIRTQDIDPADLTYGQGLGTPRSFENFRDLEGVPRVEVTPSDIILASDEHSGSAGIVRLATMGDGRTVAIKAYEPYVPPNGDRNSPENIELINNAILDEARGLERAEALGIGPEFHGVFVDEFGRTNVVMDVVTGDFPSEAGEFITASTLREFDNMYERIHSAGFNGSLGDFQFYITRDGHPRVIDAGSLADTSRIGGGRDSFLNSQASDRISLLRGGGPNLGVPYLEELRTAQPEQYATTMRLMQRYLGDHRAHLVEPYRDYFNMAIERQRGLQTR